MPGLCFCAQVTVAISKSARDKMRRRKNKAEREQLLREQERKERLEESLRERLRAIDIDCSPEGTHWDFALQ